MVLDSEPLSKIFTVGLSYWRISKETYYGLPTRRVLGGRLPAVLSGRLLTCPLGYMYVPDGKSLISSTVHVLPNIVLFVFMVLFVVSLSGSFVVFFHFHVVKSIKGSRNRVGSWHLKLDGANWTEQTPANTLCHTVCPH